MKIEDQRIALVTGANRGIGEEIARQLAAAGYHAVIGCRDEEAGHKAVKDILGEGNSASLQLIDVGDPESASQAIRQIQDDYGRLDVLVNNAGVQLDRGVSVLDVSEPIMKETFEVNYFGALRLIQAAVPLMAEQQYGRIVNVSSGLGAFDILQGFGGLQGLSAAYRISKTMLNALTCLVALDVADRGIKINAVCPGRVRTRMGGDDSPLTAAEGADTAVWLATLDEQGPSGGFFRERQLIAW